MRWAGYILIFIGLALIVLVVYSFWSQKNRLVSPVPNEDGIKVIFVTPKQ